MVPTGKYVEANGLRVYYEVYGEGEPLLLPRRHRHLPALSIIPSGLHRAFAGCAGSMCNRHLEDAYENGV
jgi:hypothetical protein